MPKIFVSYRRADSQQVTERIHDRLAIGFGKENVFLDVEIGNIPVGSDFAKVLSDAVNECEIVVLVINHEEIRTWNLLEESIVNVPVFQSLQQTDNAREIYDLAFSPDGFYLVVGSGYGLSFFVVP